jgi:hypothetical protein
MSSASRIGQVQMERGPQILDGLSCIHRKLSFLCYYNFQKTFRSISIKMRFSILSVAGLATMVAADCSSGTYLDRRAEKVGFGYGYSDGPHLWHTLSPDYALCKTGHNQSPIDVGKNSILYQMVVDTSC